MLLILLPRVMYEIAVRFWFPMYCSLVGSVLWWAFISS